MNQVLKSVPSKRLFARIHPHNPKIGCNVQRYKAADRMWIGGLEPAWIEVSREEADKLRLVSQDPYTRNAVALFQILDEDERAALENDLESRRRASLGLTAGRLASAPITEDFNSVTSRSVSARSSRSAAIPDESAESV